MDCVIVLMLPTPVTVHDGGSRAVLVTVMALRPVNGAHFEIQNLQPAAADVLLNGQRGDVVRTPLGNLAAGQSSHTVTIGLTLQPANALSGAIVGMNARVVANGTAQSPDHPFLGVIGTVGP